MRLVSKALHLKRENESYAHILPDLSFARCQSPRSNVSVLPPPAKATMARIKTYSLDDPLVASSEET